MADLILQVFEEDDTTVYFEVGTSAAHANPYLHEPEVYSESEIDIRDCTARIGRMNVRIADPQTGATQITRFLTGLLGNATGHSELNGRRMLMKDASGSPIILDGVVAGVKLSQSFAGFELAAEDIRSRGIKVPVFSQSGTSTVFPRGVLNGYGLLPSGSYLAPATTPAVGTFRRATSGTDGVLSLSTGLVSPTNQQVASTLIQKGYVLTDKTRNALRPVWSDAAQANVLMDVEVWWRNVGTSPWNVLANMPVRYFELPPSSSGNPGKVGGQSVITPYQILDESTGLTPSAHIYLSDTATVSVPSDGASVEILLVYTGPPSEDYPFHFEGTAGTLLRNVLRGDYSYSRDDEGAWTAIDPRLRYDESYLTGANAPAALNEPVRLRIFEEEESLRDWLEDACRVLGVAPALDELGQIAPVGQQLPDASVTLAQIDDSNAQPIAAWEHPATDAVTQVDGTYPRDFLLPASEDPDGTRAAGDGIASVEQKVTVRPEDSAIQTVMGVQSFELDAFLFRALGGAEGQPLSGDTTEETAARQIERRGHELIDRFAYGGQVNFRKMARSDAAIEALKVGDWVIDACSWDPNYATGERGRNHLAQVVAIKDVNSAWREVRIVDAAPYANPVAQPTLGTVTASAAGVVSVPVTAIPSGVEARVDYAVNATEPAGTSPLWTFLGRTASVATLTSPALPAGSTVWIRARGEKEGLRPSAWTNAVSVTLASTPRIKRAGILLVDGAASVAWDVNAVTNGVRMYYAIHSSTAAPGTLTSFVDVDAADGQASVPGTLLAGQDVTVELEPWTGFGSGSVSGTAGDRFRLSASYGASAENLDSSYGLIYFREVAASAPGYRRFSWASVGTEVASVWWAFKSFPAPWAVDNWSIVAAEVSKLPDGQNWVEFPAVTAGNVGALQVEPRLADGTVYADDLIHAVQIYPVPPKINGWIDAKYVAGLLQVYAGADPTDSALPVAYEIRADSKTGTVLASGSWSTAIAAQAGVGPADDPDLANVTPPTDGKATWWAKFTDAAGNIQWANDSVSDPAKPRIRTFQQLLGSSVLAADLALVVESPLGRDVTLYGWVNPGGTDSPDPGGAADTTLAIPFTGGTPGAYEVTAADTWADASALLDDVPVFPGIGKTVHFEAIDELGFTSGVQSFTLHSWGTIQRADGTVIDDAIDRPAAFAASIAPIQLVSSLPGSGSRTGEKVFVTTTSVLYEWDGAAWNVSTPTVGDYSFLPVIIAGSVSTNELAFGAATGSKLNVARVFVTGMTLTNNSPGAGSVAWSACEVTFEGTTYSVAAGNTSNPIIWWDESSPTAFKSSTDTDDLVADGFFEQNGDAVIVLNEGGTSREIWNGTLIYGGTIVTDAVKARHMDSITMRVGKYIESTVFSTGVDGWRINADGSAEFLDVLVRGILQIVDGTSDEIQFLDSSGTQIGGISTYDSGGYVGLEILDVYGASYVTFRSSSSLPDLYSIEFNGPVRIPQGLFADQSGLTLLFHDGGSGTNGGVLMRSPDMDSNGDHYVVCA